MAFFSSPGRHSTWGTRETFFAIPWKCTAFIRMLSGWIWKGVLSDVDWWAEAEKHCLLYRVKWQFGNVGTLRGQPSGLLHRVWFSKNFNSLFWKVCGHSALYQSDDVPCNCARDIRGCTVWCIPDHPAAAAFSYGGFGAYCNQTILWRSFGNCKEPAYKIVGLELRKRVANDFYVTG